MAYLKLIKTHKDDDKLAEKINDYIESKIRIHTRDIHYAIRYCDKEIISLMLDNIPSHEYYPCFYGAVVRGNRSADIIDLLFERKVPMDDNILIFCIVDKKPNYIDYFVEKNPYLITAFVLIEALNNHELITHLVELIKKNNIYIEHYELVVREANNLYLIDNKDYEMLEKLQEYNPLKVLFFDEEKEIELYQNRGFDIIKQNTQTKTKHIVKAIEMNSFTLLADILPKYGHTVNDKILSKCKNKEMCDLITKHNEEYTKK